MIFNIKIKSCVFYLDDFLLVFLFRFNISDNRMGVELDCCTVGLAEAESVAPASSEALAVAAKTESVRSRLLRVPLEAPRSMAASAAGSAGLLLDPPPLRRVRRCSGKMLAKLEPKLY